MKSRDRYVIRGGMEGRERLRVLSRALQATTSSFLDRLGLRDGMRCLDVGCGGGDVTVELARRVSPDGTVLGVDIDETTIGLAAGEARAAGVDNVAFRAMDIHGDARLDTFDVIYARFLLTHLRDPGRVVATLLTHLRPGGLLAVEDIDFGGSFTWPESRAYRRYHDLYVDVVRRRGCDPDIGKRLPLLLMEGGLDDVEMNVVQPMGMRGDVKLLNPITMENIADTVVRDGLASREEIASVASELYRFAEDPGTIAGLPRIVQAWGRRSAG